MTNSKKANYSKIALTLFISVTALLLFLVFGGINAQARTITIMDPEDMKNINWSNAGFGPGNTYVLGADMTLGEDEDSEVNLTKGNFVIDFNGHTLQNSRENLCVISVRGANVTLMDSKASNSKPSVRSYGQGAVQITAGSLKILNGNYLGLGNEYNNPGGLHVGGGTCVVDGGYFYGGTIGVSCAGGTLYINGGTFQTGYMFALEDFGGKKISISKGKFISGKTTYGYQFALGAYSPNSYYDFSTWLAKGSSFSESFDTCYWNMQSQVSAYPTMACCFAASYQTPELSVKSSVKKPKAPKIKKIARSKNALTVKWKKSGKNVTGYEIQIARNKKFTKGKKTVIVKSKKAASKKVAKLKSDKKYYVKVRAYRNFNGTTLYSKWSKTKVKNTK